MESDQLYYISGSFIYMYLSWPLNTLSVNLVVQLFTLSLKIVIFFKTFFVYFNVFPFWQNIHNHMQIKKNVNLKKMTITIIVMYYVTVFICRGG